MTAAMIFAAGLGTRMRPLTDDRPKSMVQVAGRPLIDQALDQARGADPIVVNTHHHPASLRAHLADAPVTLIHEATLLETGGGLKNALPLLGPDPVMTLNSDAAWTGARAIDTLGAAWRDEMEGLLLLVPQSRSVGHAGGDFALGPDGRIARDKTGHAYTGAGLVRTEGLAAIPDTVFSLRDLWWPMIERGTLYGVIHPGHWADVGTPDGIARAEAMLARG